MSKKNSFQEMVFVLTIFVTPGRDSRLAAKLKPFCMHTSRYDLFRGLQFKVSFGGVPRKCFPLAFTELNGHTFSSTRVVWNTLKQPLAFIRATIRMQDSKRFFCRITEDCPV